MKDKSPVGVTDDCVLFVQLSITRLTSTITAGARVECALPHHDLLGNDGETVHISFLGDPLLPQVFRSRPQI